MNREFTFQKAFLMGAFFILGCATQKDPITGFQCMTDRQAEWKLDNYKEHFIATDPEAVKESDDWRLLGDDCWKRQYKIRGYHAIIFMDSFTKGLNGIYGNRPFKLAPKIF